MSTFLIVGGTGKTGGRVASQLAGEHQVRAASRHGSVRFDWADPSSFGPALAAADGVFLTVPGQAPEGAARVGEFLHLAARSGTKRVVLLSARAAEFHPDGALAAIEEVVRQSPVAHTILRPSWFAQNFTEGFLAPDEHGNVTAPTGVGGEPFVDLDDVADVAVAALTSGAVDGTIAISGSEALSFGEAVDALARSTGRALHFEAADPERYRAKLAEQLPEEYVAWRMAMFDAIRDGRDAYLSSGVEDVLGRPARSFTSWAAERAADSPLV
jgi:uncharacterized protein YbjT (DUF2867 family)